MGSALSSGCMMCSCLVECALDHRDMWRKNLRKNEEGQWDTVPTTGSSAGSGPMDLAL